MLLNQPTGVTMSPDRPLAVVKGRYRHVYGFDGNGRGFRLDPNSGEVVPAGMSPPVSAATFAQTTATTNIIASVKIVSEGEGYYEPPVVTFRGGGLADGDENHATGRAQMRGNGVGAIILTSAGAGYTSNPQVELSGGRGTGAQIDVGYSGGIESCPIVNQGAGYAAGATITFAGVTGALAVVNTDADGKVDGINILNAGTGATTTAVATIHGAGTGAQVDCQMFYRVDGVTVADGGQNYAGRVSVQFESVDGGGAAAYLTANTSGQLESPVLLSKGRYSVPPTANVNGSLASAVAMIRTPLKGDYRCAYRYVDETPIEEGGPIPSNISEFTTVEAGEGADAIEWNWSNEGADSRASAVELFRSSANQAIVLYRVALLERVDGELPTSYTDTLSEAELIDPTREGYAFLPVTLPSGQLNALRFTPPPEDYSDVVWFQDRAWFAVNPERPNALRYSEIDEPESVPEENELVVQENAGEQDEVRALVPFGSMMLIGQERHLYKLTYIAQPVIDAAINLVGYRGILNNRCWASHDGTVYIADSYGLYAFDGSSMSAMSVAVDNRWRDGEIDFTQSIKFFVNIEPQKKIVRFHYLRPGETGHPVRAMCYCITTQTWWDEEYPEQLGDSCIAKVEGQQQLVTAGESKVSRFGQTHQDYGSTAVNYSIRSPNFPIDTDPNKAISIIFEPSQNNAQLNLHYNNSPTPRPNAIATGRGDGVVSVAGGGAQIDMSDSRSSLGDSNGIVTVRYSGGVSDRSGNGDRHIAMAITGAQTSEQLILYGAAINGAGS
jgi:hypothetical protein